MSMVNETKSVITKDWLKLHFNDIAAFGGLVLCIVIFSIIPPLFGESIWTGEKLSTLMSNVIVTAIMSVGAVFVYSLGSMDISVGGQVGLYATLFVLLGNITGSLLYPILIAVVISIIIAIINGATGELLDIPPIIPSIVFMMILQGTRTLIYTVVGTRNISLINVNISIFKQSWFMMLVLVIEVLVVSYLFKYTKFGKNAKAIGANKIAAKQSGINIVKFKVISYVIMGLCVVVGSMFQMGYTGSASDSTGIGFEMNIMVALILGGMPLSGGMKSRVSCAIIGAFTFSILNIGLPMIGVPTNMTFLIKAIIFIMVVLITCRRPTGALPR